MELLMMFKIRQYIEGKYNGIGMIIGTSYELTTDNMDNNVIIISNGSRIVARILYKEFIVEGKEHTIFI